MFFDIVNDCSYFFYISWCVIHPVTPFVPHSAPHLSIPIDRLIVIRSPQFTCHDPRLLFFLYHTRKQEHFCHISCCLRAFRQSNFFHPPSFYLPIPPSGCPTCSRSQKISREIPSDRIPRLYKTACFIYFLALFSFVIHFFRSTKRPMTKAMMPTPIPV